MMARVSVELGTQDIPSILATLGTALKEGSVSERRHQPSLSRLKELARSAENAQELAGDEAIDIISTIGLNAGLGQASQEALKCIANVLFLQPSARQTLVDLGRAPKVAHRLNTHCNEDEFLCYRILFLLTYESSLDFAVLFKTCALATTINDSLARHANTFMMGEHTRSLPKRLEAELALCEVLKLVFNITHKFPHLTSLLIPSVTSITCMLRQKERFRVQPLQPPLSLLVNALLNFDLANNCKTTFFPPENAICNVQALVAMLDDATMQYGADQLDSVAEPLLTLIRRCFESAPANVRQSMQLLLLPLDDERMQPLGKSKSLASRLLRLSSSAHAPRIRTSISAFFYELSDQDPAKFVHNLGYGYASGFLASNNLPVPPLSAANSNDLDSTSNVEHTEATGCAGHGQHTSKRDINVVTGQFLDQEKRGHEPQMTEEEKVREAEKLFILFERLKKTGVIEVENPIRAAVESGRFEQVE